MIFLVLLGGVLSGRGWTLDRIRSRYAASLNLDAENNSHTLVLRMSYAAIGLQTTRIRFFFQARQQDPQNDPYQMVTEPVRIVVRYNTAASVLYYNEFLYAPSGALIFALLTQKAANGRSEAIRLYYSGGRLLRVDRNKEGRSRIRNKGFTTEDRKDAARALRYGGGYRPPFGGVTGAGRWSW